MDVNSINLRIENIDFWGPNRESKGGMRIYWESDIGFGSLDIIKRGGNDGYDVVSPYAELKLGADTETMDSNTDKSFTAKILSLLIEKLDIEG